MFGARRRDPDRDRASAQRLGGVERAAQRDDVGEVAKRAGIVGVMRA
jgi:hypothetical protein